MNKSWVGRLFAVVIILLLLVMTTSQVMIKFNLIVPVDTLRRDGVVYEKSTLYRKTYRVVLSISSDKSKLLVNGEEVNVNKNKAGDYELTLHANDYVQLYSPKEEDNQISVFICECDDAVISPVKASKYVLECGYVDIFKVQVK